MKVTLNFRLPRWVVLSLLLPGLLRAADTPPPDGAPPPPLEQRIAGRADKILERLALADATAAAKVREAVLQFYRGLHAVHHERDTRLAAVPAGDAHGHHRIRFETDKQSAQVAGKFLGALSLLLSDVQTEAVKDEMTFAMLPLSVSEYDRMFPALDARHRAQLRVWLVESRETAVIAGSAEAKLDVFRVNKQRMHAYLAAQGLDVESAVRAEQARQAAAKKAQ